MSQLIDNSLVEKTFYKVKLFLQPEGGDKDSQLDISEGISGIVILKKFNEFSMPIVRVVINLTIKQMQYIQKNFNKGEAYFSLNKYVQNRSDARGEPQDAMDAIYTNVPMTIIGLDRTEVDSNYAEEDNSDGHQANIPNISFPIELVPSIALEMNEQVTPRVMNDTDTINVLAKVISDNFVTGWGYKVCMAKPDLNMKYKTFNVPSKSLHQFIKYTQQVYGIYNSPLISFFDLDKYFLMASGNLAKFPTDKPLYLDNCSEAHITFVTDSETQLTYTEGSYFDPTVKVAKVVGFKEPRVDLADPAKKYLEGDHVKLVSGNFSERESHECFMQQMGDMTSLVGKEKVRVVRYDNPTMVKQYQFESQENYAPTQIDVDNVDIRIFDPRKKFLFINNSEEQGAVEGYWRLVNVQFTFMGEGNSEDTIMTLNTKAEFKPYLADL